MKSIYNNFHYTIYMQDKYNNSNLKTKKVLVILGKYVNGITTYRKYDKTSKKYYNSGFVWDVWSKISHKLKHYYNFKYYYTDLKKNPNYNKICNDIAEGKYDICVGLFRRTKEREKIINFSTPLMIDANAVLYKKNDLPLLNFIGVVEKIWTHLLLLIVLGLLFGLLLYFFDKKRKKFQLKNRNNSNYYYFLRSIVTGIGAIFGEMGYLLERTSLTTTGIFLSIIIVLISFIMIMYMQGKITTILVNQEIKIVSENNIHTKPIIGMEGDAVLEILEQYDGNIIKKNNNFDEIVEFYLKNPDKYLGVGIAYCEGYKYTKMYPLDLAIGFGFWNGQFAVSSKNNEFRNDINYEISALRGTGGLQRICHGYFGKINDLPTCSLR